MKQLARSSHPAVRIAAHIGMARALLDQLEAIAPFASHANARAAMRLAQDLVGVGHALSREITAGGHYYETAGLGGTGVPPVSSSAPVGAEVDVRG